MVRSTDSGKQRVLGRHNYPSKHVDPGNFLENDEVARMLEPGEKVSEEDSQKIFNCVHCNECGTSHDRAMLTNKFIESGCTFEGRDEIERNFKANDTPYQSNKMRIRVPPGIPETSDRLFFMGCLSTIKLPKFTEDALKYLLARGIDFTILKTEACCGYPVYAAGLFGEYERVKAKNAEIFKQYKEVVCLCPACFFLFASDYPRIPTKFTYISEYLTAPAIKKAGSVSVQHMCQLQNRGHPEVSLQTNRLLAESGYDVKDVPHWCCGGGKGYMYRTDVIDKIAETRMQDFTGDYMTTMCPGCYWVLKVYGAKCKVEPRLKDMFELLT
jgi:Fe-S oxidoreductase